MTFSSPSSFILDPLLLLSISACQFEGEKISLDILAMIENDINFWLDFGIIENFE